MGPREPVYEAAQEPDWFNDLAQRKANHHNVNVLIALGKETNALLRRLINIGVSELAQDAAFQAALDAHFAAIEHELEVLARAAADHGNPELEQQIRDATARLTDSTTKVQAAADAVEPPTPAPEPAPEA